MEDIVSYIEGIKGNGYAYDLEDGVYFDVMAFDRDNEVRSETHIIATIQQEIKSYIDDNFQHKLIYAMT